MNATDDDEFGEFLGLPSDLGTSASSHIQQHQEPVSKLSEPDDLFNALYGNIMDTGQPKTQERNDSQYDELFGDSKLPGTGILSASISITSQVSGNELAHEPLFPDVDETKIQPTLGLGRNLTENHPKQTVTSEGDFSIVVDPSGLDSRFIPQGSGPMAGWVIPTGHSRRDSNQIRPVQNSFQPSTPSVRPPSTGGPHHITSSIGPLHPRPPPGGAGSRSVRIPLGCNPDLEPEFPTRAAPDQALKLPGQTRVTPDEYKEFLGLGHGEIFDLDLDRVVEPPWRAPGADSSDFFNYEMDEMGWKDYCRRIESHRQEFSMKKKIQTYESTSLNFQQDPDLPPEVAAAIAAETGNPRSGVPPEMPKALPIPVFQGLDDYSLRNRRGRDFRRPEVRYDSEVIVELVGGVETSHAVNADYGEDYIGIFGPGDDFKDPSKHGMEQIESIGAEKPIPEIKRDEAMYDSVSCTTPDEDVCFRGVSGVTEEEDEDLKKKLVKENASAMFEDEDYGNQFDHVQPGELAMGMETDPHVGQQWTAPKASPPPVGRGGGNVPPRPDFGRGYEFYMPHHQEMWRSFHHGPPGRGWRPRGNHPEFWNPGRGGYGRHFPDGRRGGGRHWPGNPFGYGRRPPRQMPPQRYEDYPSHSHGVWPPNADHGGQLDPDSEYNTQLIEGEKGGGSIYREYVDEKHYHGRDHIYSNDREHRRYDENEWEDEKQRPVPYLGSKSRSRDYDPDYRSEKKTPYHREHNRSRKDDYDERHREKRRRGKSSERRQRRGSKDKSRTREKEEKRSRRHESTSDTGSDPLNHYRNRNE